MSGFDSAIVVLVDFEDKPIASGAAQRFNDLFFSTEKMKTKSVTEYFADVSSGKISFSGEVLGPKARSGHLSRSRNMLTALVERVANRLISRLLLPMLLQLPEPRSISILMITMAMAMLTLLS